MDNEMKKKKGHGCLIAIIILIVLIGLSIYGGYKFVVSTVENGTMIIGNWECDNQKLVMNSDKTYSWLDMKGTYKQTGSIGKEGIIYDVILENNNIKTDYTFKIVEQTDVDMLIINKQTNEKYNCKSTDE